MSLDPETLRHNPQLAAIDLLVQTAETAIVALCAAHPAIEHKLRHDPHPPIECLADHVVHQAMKLLDALDRYQILLHDLDRLDRLDDDAF
jgi:hypothetical protein